MNALFYILCGLILVIFAAIVIFIIVTAYIRKIELEEITKVINIDTKKPDVRAMARYNSGIIHGGKII